MRSNYYILKVINDSIFHANNSTKVHFNEISDFGIELTLCGSSIFLQIKESSGIFVFVFFCLFKLKDVRKIKLQKLIHFIN
jgi:hypothetical protein